MRFVEEQLEKKGNFAAVAKSHSNEIELSEISKYKNMLLWQGCDVKVLLPKKVLKATKEGTIIYRTYSVKQRNHVALHRHMYLLT